MSDIHNALMTELPDSNGISLLTEMREAVKAGFSILPVRAGSKAPAVASWKPYQDQPPTRQELLDMGVRRAPGFGVVAGPGGLQTLDFDDLKAFEHWCDHVEAAGHGAVLRRVLAGYLDATPSGGRRVLAIVPGATFQDQSLARRSGKVLIERTRFAVVAPSDGSVHPSGRPYERLSGGFQTLALLSASEWDALLTAARALDETPRREAVVPRESSAAGTRPGDLFAAQTTWAEILQPHGWTPVYTRGDATFWRRPDKADGISASTNHAGSGLFYPFTSSTAFEADRSYSKFAAYAVLNHAGDFTAAALALAEQGFTEPVPTLAPDRERVFTDFGAGIGYRMRFGDIELTLDRFHTVYREAAGTLAATVGDAPISPVSFRHLNGNERSSVVSYLTKRTPVGRDVNWAALLDEFCARIDHALRMGEPTYDGSTFPLQDESAMLWNFHGATFLQRDANMLVGDGDSCKSYLAQAVLHDLQSKGHRVGILDSESMGIQRYIRRAMNLTGTRAPFRYIPMMRPLDQDIERVRREIVDYGLDVLMLDSVAQMVGGSLQSEEAPKAYRSALNYLGVGKDVAAISIAHTRKNRQPGEPMTAFGSAYWRNLCSRNTWNVEVARKDENTALICLKHDKHNDSGGAPDVFLQFTFNATIMGRVTVERVEGASLESGERGLSGSTAAVVNTLQERGSLTVNEIVNVSSVPRRTVSWVLGNRGDLFEKQEIQGLPAVWRLRADYQGPDAGSEPSDGSGEEIEI